MRLTKINNLNRSFCSVKTRFLRNGNEQIRLLKKAFEKLDLKTGKRETRFTGNDFPKQGQNPFKNACLDYRNTHKGKMQKSFGSYGKPYTLTARSIEYGR